jgi:hypothetical protein
MRSEPRDDGIWPVLTTTEWIEVQTCATSAFGYLVVFPGPVESADDHLGLSSAARRRWCFSTKSNTVWKVAYFVGRAMLLLLL